MLSHLKLLFQHWAGVRPYTSSYDFAKSWVFSKHSLSPFCDTFYKKVLFLPKLQSYFAEFLKNSYLKRFNL